MLVAALVCPHPPLLMPGLTGAADVLPDLRAACLDGVRALTAARPDAVVLVGSAPRPGRWQPGLPRGAGRFSAGRAGGGSAAGAGPVLPLSLAVGEQLLDDGNYEGERELRAVAAAAPAAECLVLGADLARSRPRTALLVLGDGSARRTLKAPGYLDGRAAAYDGQARRGLAGDLAALRSLDAGLGTELLAAGRAPWQVLAGAAADRPPPRAVIRYEDDPFGVWYAVASWSFPD